MRWFQRKPAYTFNDVHHVFPQRHGKPIELLNRFQTEDREIAYEIKTHDGRLGMAYVEEIRPMPEEVTT